MSNRPQYKVERERFGIGWHVWDNWGNRIYKTVTNRAECRRLVTGLNKGWITDEVEKETSGDTAA